VEKSRENRVGWLIWIEFRSREYWTELTNVIMRRSLTEQKRLNVEINVLETYLPTVAGRSYGYDEARRSSTLTRNKKGLDLRAVVDLTENARACQWEVDPA